MMKLASVYCTYVKVFQKLLIQKNVVSLKTQMDFCLCLHAKNLLNGISGEWLGFENYPRYHA